MDLSKLRSGEIAAGIGALLLLISLLFLKWYGFDVSVGGVEFGVATSINAWDGSGFLGTIANIIILAAGVVGLGLVIVKAASKSVSLPVAASSLTAAGGIAAAVLIVLRIFFRPGTDLGLKFGIFLALVGAVVQAVGGWKSMQEEGTTFGEARDQLGKSMGGPPSGGGPPGGGAPPPPGGGGEGGPPSSAA